MDDGSTDNTWNLIETYSRENPVLVKGIRLSANMGHQKALLAGMLAARHYADVVITIDADLQDDVDAIDEMLECYRGGDEIVCGVRSNRKGDGLFKRISAALFYSFMRLLGAKLIYNHADFRLMSSKAIAALAERNESRLFLRGLVPHLGYKTSRVLYERKKRAAGTSKYSLRKMLGLAFDGIAGRYK